MIKKYKVVKFIIVTITILINSLVLSIYTNAQSTKINSFESNIDINKDGTLTIEEFILMDFGTEQKHGLVRDITYKRVNLDGDRKLMPINILSVTDDTGATYNYSLSKISDYIELKIGDEDKLVSGIKTYIIKYQVSGAITYFTDHDELYWNLTGNYWKYPIESFKASIKLPEGATESNIKLICYEGDSSSDRQTCSTKYDNGYVLITSSRMLVPGEGVTSSISFPKELVQVLEPQKDEASILARIMRIPIVILASYWYLFLPVRILIGSIKERSFTKRYQRIVTAWFEPPQYNSKDALSPAETGFLLDKKINHRELTATIIHLAQRGFIKIREDSKNYYSFIKQKDTDTPGLKDFEKKLLEALFEKGNEVRDRDLKNSRTLFTKIEAFNKQVEDSLMREKMFEQTPSNIDAKNMILTGVGFTTLNVLLGFAALIFGRGSAKRTIIGIEKYSEAKSLMNFLQSQDEQLNFQANNQMFFEKLLPYAAAFGVEKIWAARFKDIPLVKPEWYEGSNFTSAAFVNGMTSNIGGSMRSAVTSSMSSTRSSSGFSSGFSGGHSGGGGGGGGGGSW